MKVTGPGMSLSASGSLAGTLVYSRWKGRPYIRQLVIPSNPKSPAQTAFRGMWGFLSNQWKNFAPEDWALWVPLGEQGNYSPFNAYVKFNQDRWSHVQYPKMTPDIAPDTPGTWDDVTANAGVRLVDLSLTLDAVGDNWGAVIYRKVDTAPDGLFSEAIAVVSLINDTPTHYVDTAVLPGVEYHYKAQPFSFGGVAGLLSADTDATPTS